MKDWFVIQPSYLRFILARLLRFKEFNMLEVIALAVLSAQQSAPAAAPDFATAASTTLLTCSGTAPGHRQAATDSRAVKPSTVTVELFREGGALRVLTRGADSSSRQSYLQPVSVLADDPVRRYFHLELTGSNQAQHLFFTLGDERLGNLLWSTAEQTVQLPCRSL